MKTIILGGGLAGLSAAYHLKTNNYLILEKEREVGGLCRSKKVGNFTFDYAPHIFFTKDEYVKSLIRDILIENLIQKERKAYIYLYNTYIKYPFEVHLGGLPKEVIEESIFGVMDAKSNERPANFKEWIYSAFGEGIARHYMIPYNEKVWKYDLEKMDIDWVGGRVPSPDIKEIIRGVIGTQTKDFGPNAIFSYPLSGGIGSLPKAFLNHIMNISCSSEVVKIGMKKDELSVVYKKGGKSRTMRCEKILSSLPLPSLIDMMEDAPEDVHKAARRLAYNSLLCINIGVDREGISDKHWLYFPEKKYAFNRISFPMNFSRYTTPPKKSSILTEITYPKDGTVDVEEVKRQVIDGLIDAGIIKREDALNVVDISNFTYAYVIHELNRDKNVKIVHEFLKNHNIIPIGRFGEWRYLNMDASILSGKHAALALNKRGD